MNNKEQEALKKETEEGKLEKEKIKFLIRNILSQRENIFLKEQDIQLYLAMKLIDSNIFDNVFVEYRVPVELLNGYAWSNDNKVDVDIVLEKDGLYLPIEIKYKTKETEVNALLFGQHNCNIVLTKDGAETNSTYYVWKDVKRNEVLSSTFNNVINGITIFITNDNTYLSGPGVNTQYFPFCFRDGNSIRSIVWNDAPQEKLIKFPNFSLDNDYLICWEELEHLDFKLLLL